MRVDIRIYKRFDTDLVALCDAGYPLSRMFHDTLTAFANGQQIHYLVDIPLRFDPDGKSSVHYAFSIPESDEKTCGLLKSIQKGYRNSFCKAVLRNAMVNQNVGCYLAGEKYMDVVRDQIAAIDPSKFENLIPLSEIRSGTRQVQITFVKNAVPEIRKTEARKNPIPQKTEAQKPVAKSTPENREKPAVKQAELPETAEDDSPAPELADNDALLKIFDAL